MKLTKEHNDLLLSRGNTYKTKVNLDNDTIEFKQRNWIASIFFLAFSILAYFMSPWFGLVILIIGILLLSKVAILLIDIEKQNYLLRTGYYPLIKKHVGEFKDIENVTLRQIRQTRSTDGTGSFGKWIIWDINIHFKKTKYIFSVWEEGDEAKTRAIAELLASIFQCKLENLSNIKNA